MKVYLDTDGGKRLIGRADIPDRGLPYFEVLLFGAASTIADRYAIGTVTHLPAGGPPIAERALILALCQIPELLPGWQPLQS